MSGSDPLVTRKLGPATTPASATPDAPPTAVRAQATAVAGPVAATTDTVEVGSRSRPRAPAARPGPTPPAPAAPSGRIARAGEADPRAQLKRLGVEPLRTAVPSLDAARLLKVEPDGQSATFSYPNAADPTRPTVVKLVAFSAYAPAGSRAHRTVADPRVAALLAKPEAGTANNFENSDMKVVGRLVADYVRDHASAVAALGITDIRHLTVAQTATLAGLITVDASNYNMTSIGFEGTAAFHPSLRAGLARLRRLEPEVAARQDAAIEAPAGVRDMDSRGVEKFLGNDAASEDGVCRNYCETFQAVWGALQGMQRPETNELTNTYVKFPMGGYHIWPALYTVQADGSLLGTQLDPTWADGAGQTPSPATITGALSDDPSGPSYAVERARFALQDMHLSLNGVTKAGLLTDYYTVWLKAHDLAAQGQADAGARLLVTFLNDLPDITQEDLIDWTQRGLVDVADKEAAWKRPGAVELAHALRGRLHPESAPNS